METVMKHFSVEERKLQEVQEIAEREGRKDYDIFREAIAQYLQDKETDSRVHPQVPGDGVVRPNDKVLDLNFVEMWVDSKKNKNIDDCEHGDIIRSIEDSGKYFTYYKFVYLDNYFVCQQVAPISYDLLEELNRRTAKYQP